MPFPSPDQSHPEPAPLAPQAQLPQNIEAEQSVLAACLLNHEVTEEAVMRIKPENFFRPAHRIIFEAIQGLVIRRFPVDPISSSAKPSSASWSMPRRKLTRWPTTLPTM